MRQSWFSWRSWGIGATCGIAVAVTLAAETSSSPGRYQLHVWEDRQPSNTVGLHGAYRLDTQTGEVISINVADTAVKVQIPK